MLMLLAAAAAGCIMTPEQMRRSQDLQYQRDAEVRALRVELQRLQERLDGIEGAQQRLYADIDTLREATQRERQTVETALAKLNLELRQAATARDDLKRELVDALSKKMAALLQQVQQQSQAAAGRRVQRGYEHVVRRGETLSAIAVAYKTSVEVIVRANNLSSADAIREGQTLFIPE